MWDTDGIQGRYAKKWQFKGIKLLLQHYWRRFFLFFFFCLCALLILENLWKHVVWWAVVLMFAFGLGCRPKLLLGTDNQRVCISLACAPSSSDLLVASFRPKVETSEDATASQVYLSQTPTPSGGGKLGYHSFIRRAGNSSSFTEDRTCSTLVSEIRMSKSAIIPYGNNQHLFAYGDESLRGVRTWRLPSFEMHSDLSSLQQPVLDLRYAESSSGGRYLGYLSTEKLQVFRIR